jgi:3'-phosphoadenosine 5'-phosphosulfate sulfotransferase (PAPS reductase)/FAD synthetase
MHLDETGFLDAWQAGGGRVLRIFMDTGWELPETYRYLDQLEGRFGKIHRLATWVPGPGEAKPDGYDFMAPVWVDKNHAMDGDRWAMALIRGAA